MKYFAFILLLMMIISCGESDNKNSLAFSETHKESIKQNLTLLENLADTYSAELQSNADRNQYEAKIYFDFTKRYLNFLNQFETRIGDLKIVDTLNLNKYYVEKINEVSAFTDSIKALEELKLYKGDRDLLKFIKRSALKMNSATDYELLKLLYLQDFKTQILNAAYIVHPVFGCLKIRYPMFYDFMIIQNNIINDKTYSITVKNNYMFHYIEKKYFITFKILKKIASGDTAVFNEKITMNVDNQVYKTSAIPYEKGKYLLTLNMNIELPSGLIKTDEMNFEYELK